MAEQQNKDWLDKLGEFFSKIFINPNKDIAYSIRKRGDDEIEIRDSIFDGYARGFIRFVLGGMMLINIFNGLSVIPFYSHSDTKRDYEWAFHRDKMLMEEYKSYKERREEGNKFREKKLELTPYEI